MSDQVIFVDDEATIREAVQQWLELSGFEVRLCLRAEECLGALDKSFAGVVISDVRMPGMDGLQLLANLQAVDRDLPVIMVTGHGDVPMAVEAMRQGAYDFIEKPFTPERLLGSLRRALEKRRLVLENRRLKEQASLKDQVDARLLGVSKPMEALRRQVLALAPTPVNVLIRGETGSGKELVARCLHDFGPRADKPFVALNCAAIPEQLFESELFGHESGAFTGAQGKRIGKLEHAHGGTLFLDEIESMSLDVQVKLLRLLQERVVERLGSNQLIPLDIRIIAATKEDLRQAADQGRFRADLYYRLNVASLRIPPLRERGEDIPLLFRHFAEAGAMRHGLTPRELDAGQSARLLAYDWPGNVRELQNAAERFALGLGLSLDDGVLPDAADEPHNLSAKVEAFERSLIAAELERPHNSLRSVAEALGIPRKTLHDKLRKHGLPFNTPGENPPDDGE